jgi:phage minor structural protein
MIKVFSPTDTTFTTNGDAVINATRAVVHKVDNGDFYLELECGLEFIDYIKANNIIVAPTPQGDQAFRLEAPIETTRKKIKAKAWHVFYDSENYLIADAYVVDKNCNAALDHLNAATDNPSPFTTLSDVQTINSFRCVRQSLSEAINTVLERWGGHLVRDNFNLQIRNVIGQDNGVTIQYKKNLKEITVSEDWSAVCTKCLPVGKDGLLLDELYLYSTTQYDIPYTKTVTFEQYIEEDDYPDEASYKAALRNDLVAQCNEYLERAQYPAITYTLNANIEKITDVGDIVEVYDERLGVNITAAVLSFDYDCILGKYTQVEFGSTGASLSGLITDISSEINTSIQENNQTITIALQTAIEVAQEKIWNALGASYCIYSGDQIMIVDALPAENARNCIRINSAGIAFSQTGINGTFTTAWTIDGTFNAQAINIINLTADLIKGGTLKLGSNLNSYGCIEVYNESNTLISKLDKDGLLMYGKDGSYLVMNTEIGFAGYDRLGNKIFWADKDEFHMKKSVVEEEITLCNKLRFIPIEVYENNTLINDGIGLVSVIDNS